MCHHTWLNTWLFSAHFMCVNTHHMWLSILRCLCEVDIFHSSIWLKIIRLKTYINSFCLTHYCLLPMNLLICRYLYFFTLCHINSHLPKLPKDIFSVPTIPYFISVSKRKFDLYHCIKYKKCVPFALPGIPTHFLVV